jgi:stage III sporulation protein AB
MDKLFMVFFAAFAGLMCGLFLRKRVALREKYFEELVRIIERLISDISFSQARLETILSDYVSVSPEMSKNLEEYTAFLRGGELNLSKGILTKREHRLVKEFFERLGGSDLDTQVNELGNRKQVFLDTLTEAKRKNKSYGGAYVKLGFLGGLLIGILFI